MLKKENELNNFKFLVKKAKLRLLRMHYENKVGHIGGNLSALEIILFIHCNMEYTQDVFVLSKGHAAGALYITLWVIGQLSEEELMKFHQDNTKLAGHPVAGWHTGIRFSTGSLGHGLGLASGVALSKKIKNEKGTVYCLLSDGEWQEGSNWEALIFSAHHRLTNLTILIDLNGLQGFGKTAEVASLDKLKEKIRAFDVEVIEIDGHDIDAIQSAYNAINNRPKVIILHTVKGKGVSFMENRMEWHYLPLDHKLYMQSLEELEVLEEMSIL